MKINRIGLLLGFLLGAFATIVITKPAQAGCLKSCWSRTCARSYGYSAVNEPYRVTHAEWTDDDIKTWPEEGVDCSGLVHKTWAMKDAHGSTDFYWWIREEVLPEKYSAAGFYSNCGSTNACVKVCDGGSCPMSKTVRMDAFATLNDPANPNDNHVGLIYDEISDRRDRILEAVQQSGDQDVRIIEQGWRTDPKYRGIKRSVWSSSCSPCPSGCPVVYLPLVNKGPGNPNPYP